MSLDVDGAAILRALAKKPQAFTMSKAEVDMLATNAIAAKLREKGLSLSALRSIARAIGPRDLSTIVDGLPAKDAKAIAKLDSGHPDYAGADEHWLRAHIIKLASGEVEPTAAGVTAARAAPPAKKPDPPKLPKIGKIMASAAQATATRTRRAHPRGKGQI